MGVLSMGALSTWCWDWSLGETLEAISPCGASWPIPLPLPLVETLEAVSPCRVGCPIPLPLPMVLPLITLPLPLDDATLVCEVWWGFEGCKILLRVLRVSVKCNVNDGKVMIVLKVTCLEWTVDWVFSSVWTVDCT